MVDLEDLVSAVEELESVEGARETKREKLKLNRHVVHKVGQYLDCCVQCKYDMFALLGYKSAVDIHQMGTKDDIGLGPYLK